MPITATILSGNSEPLIGEAVRSAVEWADHVLLIDTGITDGTIAAAEAVADGKLCVEKFAWCNDFAKARNFALQAAARVRQACNLPAKAPNCDRSQSQQISNGPHPNPLPEGEGTDASPHPDPLRRYPALPEGEGTCCWALTLDTDERLSFYGIASKDELHAALAARPEIQAWLVSARDGSYAKERFIRLPTHLKWSGRTHEALAGARASERDVLPGVEFWEAPKTAVQMQTKLLRDLDMLREETAARPRDGRWWYYLGQTLQELRRPEEAIAAFEKSYEIPDGWPEQAAWSAFRAAQCHEALKQFEAAIRACAVGLTRQPQSPELAWMAGFCCYQLGRYQDAVAWEQMAIALGNVEGACAGSARIGFRHLPGWYEGPYDVLRFAWAKLDRPVEAAECEKKHAMAKHRRLLAGAGFAAAPLLPKQRGTVPFSSDRPPCKCGARMEDENRDSPQASADGLGSAASASSASIHAAVLGLYSSGSTAMAGILYCLGLCMGMPLEPDHFEPKDLAQKLRRWWDEPQLTEQVAAAERVDEIRRWRSDLETLGYTAIGVKHPLLALSPDDLREAWGAEAKFLWAWRPVEASIKSLCRRAWWPGREARIQTRLWEALCEFFARVPHLRVSFDDLLQSPEAQIDRLVEYLGLHPTADQRRDALMFVRRRGTAD